MDDTPGHRPIRSYVLRQAKISRAQKEAYEKLASFYLLSFDEEKDVRDLFVSPQPLVVEIGFGMGHATAEITKSNPGINYLGLEVHTPGVGALLARIHSEGLRNLRIIQRDAIEVMNTMVGNDSLTGVHLFFPDPWPKKKHHKRRIFQIPFLDLVWRKLMPGGYFYAVTDWQDYAEHMISCARESGRFNNPAGGYAKPLAWRPTTAFEQKGRAKNHSIYEIFLEKKKGLVTDVALSNSVGNQTFR